MKISSLILNWYHTHKRNLPWRSKKSPYKVWLSEIILQQTRVAQGLSYYNEFLSHYPTVKDLAEAKEEDVLKLWQGLGYYSRARNLHDSAKHIYYELNGQFPKSYKDLIKLKGVGPYTAAAISSICYNEAKAVVDGNVYRVLSRIFEIDTPINSSAGIKEFQLLANQLIDKVNPGDYNQGLMELGATVCSPKKPKCNLCPIAEKCKSSNKTSAELYPVKKKAKAVKNRYLNYYCINTKGAILVKKRKEKDIWLNLYDFPLIESKCESAENEHYHIKNIKTLIGEEDCDIIHMEDTKHNLSHQTLHIKITMVNLKEIRLNHSFKKVSRAELLKLPVPKPIERFIVHNFN